MDQNTIIALSVGGAVLLALILLIVIVVIKGKKKKQATQPQPVEEVKKEEPAPVKEVVEPIKEVPVEETKPVQKQETSANEDSKKVIGKYVITSEGDSFRYRLKANNGEVLVVSEPYASAKSVRNGIDTLKKNLDSETFDFVEDKHGLFSFRVMTKQGRCLATSANYSTKASAISASESLKRFATTDKIVEEEASDDLSEMEEFVEVVEPEMNGKFTFVDNGNGEFSYQLLASNGQVIATSQPYHSIAYCKEGIEKFRALVYEGKFYIFKDKNSRYQFKLYNNKKRLALAGEVYDSKDRVASVIISIRRFAKNAEVVEYKKPEEAE